MGETTGYSGKLSYWISSKQYQDLGDPELDRLARHYQRAKFIVIPCVLAGILIFGAETKESESFHLKVACSQALCTLNASTFLEKTH